MKRLTLLLMLSASAQAFAAAGPTPTPSFAQPVVSQMQMAQTCGGVAISSGTPQAVVNSPANLNSRYVYVQNVDTASDIFCSDNSGVTTSGTFASTMGVWIAHGQPGQAFAWALVPGQIWYCICNSVSGACRSVVCTGR